MLNFNYIRAFAHYLIQPHQPNPSTKCYFRTVCTSTSYHWILPREKLRASRKPHLMVSRARLNEPSPHTTVEVRNDVFNLLDLVGVIVHEAEWCLGCKKNKEFSTHPPEGAHFNPKHTHSNGGFLSPHAKPQQELCHEFKQSLTMKVPILGYSPECDADLLPPIGSQVTVETVDRVYRELG